MMMTASPHDNDYSKYYDHHDTPSRGRSSGGMNSARSVDHHSLQSSRHQNSYSHQDAHSRYHNQTSSKHSGERSSHAHSPQRVSPVAHSQHSAARPIRGVLKQTTPQPHMRQVSNYKAQPTQRGGAERYDHAHRPDLQKRRSVRFDEEERPASSSYSNNHHRSETSYDDSALQASYQQPTHSAHYETSPSPRHVPAQVEHRGISLRRNSVPESHTTPSARRNSLQSEQVRPSHGEYSNKASMRPKSYPESSHQQTKVVVHEQRDQHYQHHDYHHGEVEHNHSCSHGSPVSGHGVHNDKRAYTQDDHYNQYSSIAAPRPIRAHHYDEDEQRHIVVVVPPCDHAKRADKRNFMHRVKKVWAAATHDGTIPPPSPPSSPSPDSHHPKQTHTKDGKPMGKFAHLYDGDWKVDYPVNEGEMM